MIVRVLHALSALGYAGVGHRRHPCCSRHAAPVAGLFDSFAAAFENEDLAPREARRPLVPSCDASVLAGLTLRCIFRVTGVSTAADPSSDLHGPRISRIDKQLQRSVDADVELRLLADNAAEIGDSELTAASPAARWWLARAEGESELQVECATRGVVLVSSWRTDSGQLESLGSSAMRVPPGLLYLRGRVERFGTVVTVREGEVLVKVSKGRFNTFLQSCGTWSAKAEIGGGRDEVEVCAL